MDVVSTVYAIDVGTYANFQSTLYMHEQSKIMKVLDAKINDVERVGIVCDSPERIGKNIHFISFDVYDLINI